MFGVGGSEAPYRGDPRLGEAVGRRRVDRLQFVDGRRFTSGPPRGFGADRITAAVGGGGVGRAAVDGFGLVVGRPRRRLRGPCVVRLVGGFVVDRAVVVSHRVILPIARRGGDPLGFGAAEPANLCRPAVEVAAGVEGPRQRMLPADLRGHAGVHVGVDQHPVGDTLVGDGCGVVPLALQHGGGRWPDEPYRLEGLLNAP